MQEVKLIRYSDPERKHLAHAAAVYLGKPDTDNVRRPLSLIKKGDALNIFRGESARFEFRTSKVVYDHLVTYTTANMRACGGLRANKAQEFVLPPEVLGTDWEDVIHDQGNAHLDAYLKLTDGIDPETNDQGQKVRLQAARSVAPMSVRLHYVIEFNFTTLIEALFPQRVWTPGAQLDTYIIAKEMYEQLHAVDPALWDLAYEYYGTEVQTWKKAYHKLKKEEPALLQRILSQYPLRSMWDK